MCILWIHKCTVDRCVYHVPDMCKGEALILPSMIRRNFSVLLTVVDGDDAPFSSLGVTGVRPPPPSPPGGSRKFSLPPTSLPCCTSSPASPPALSPATSSSRPSCSQSNPCASSSATRSCERRPRSRMSRCCAERGGREGRGEGRGGEGKERAEGGGREFGGGDFGGHASSACGSQREKRKTDRAKC